MSAKAIDPVAPMIPATIHFIVVVKMLLVTPN
jgi:hypothetical protein